MFDFKKELAKFQPLPEMKDVEKIINDNNIEDLMDILREALKNKERLIMIDRHYNFNYSSGAGENGYLIKIYNLAYGSVPRWLGYCRFSDMSMGEPMNRG